MKITRANDGALVGVRRKGVATYSMLAVNRQNLRGRSISMIVVARTVTSLLGERQPQSNARVLL